MPPRKYERLSIEEARCRASVRRCGSRRTSALRFSRVATLGFVAMLASACGERLVPIAGIVVTPDGSPVANARVELFCNGDPHINPHVLQGTRTDARGRFAFPEAPTDFCDALFIEREPDLRRTYYLSSGVDYETLARNGANLYIRIAPTRPLPIYLHCSGALPPHASGRNVQLNVYWGSRDLWVVDVVPTLVPGRDPPLALLVNRDAEILEGSDPSDLERDFAIRVPLPEGNHRIEVSGRCGESVRMVGVSPGTGELRPLRVELSRLNPPNRRPPNAPSE